MTIVSKTDFISYRECRKNVWVKLHRKDIYSQYELSEFEQSLLEVGNDVEELARNMFPGGYMVEKRSAGAVELTKKLIHDKTPVIFQAVFSTDQFLAAADVLVFDAASGAYDVYEIKMSSTEEEDDDGTAKPNKKKELQFEYDLAFQTNVAAASGVVFRKKFLVRLNKKYVRVGDLDYTPGKLFIIEDKTEAVDLLAPMAGSEMGSASIYLSDEKEPVGTCECYYKGRSSHCTTFAFNNRDKNVPDYSVHDLNRIGNSKALLKELLDEGILDIGDVPEDERFMPKKGKDGTESKPRKLNQIRVHKSRKPIIELDAITSELASLTFPLYFLDYETYPTAIPIYSGYHPYQHVVFQYSLHILRSADAEPEHRECLIFEGDPAPQIAAALKRDIGPVGSVVSWYKKFENSRNKELGRTLLDDTAFFTDLVARTYDLMDIVEQQYYVHHEFYGKSSIKKVLPALIKEDGISYKGLGVKNGTDAIEAFRQISEGELTGEAAETKKREMLTYCKLDTYAMYKLWKFFHDLVRNS